MIQVGAVLNDQSEVKEELFDRCVNTFEKDGY